jgi:putative NIF3 family GTP cyclohydrolase 1 type 2
MKIINKAIITIDTTEGVVDEAIKNDCNLIITFHPIIFNGLKNITEQTYVERIVFKAIRNNINIYAIHTNLDNNPKELIIKFVKN